MLLKSDQTTSHTTKQRLALASIDLAAELGPALLSRLPVPHLRCVKSMNVSIGASTAGTTRGMNSFASYLGASPTADPLE